MDRIGEMDTLWMREAVQEARRADAAGEVPVGAVVVVEGELVARAHNMKESRVDPTAHAEMIALRLAAESLGRWRLSDAVLYVTLEPCPMCAGALVNARIGRLVYGTPDPKAGACGSVMDITGDERLNHRVPLTSGVLETECASVLRDFFAAKRSGRATAALGPRPVERRDGRVRLKAPDSKSGVGVTPPGVRIPLSPPVRRASVFMKRTQRQRKRYRAAEARDQQAGWERCPSG